MPDTPTFVVNDRRKFTSEGELRHDSVSEPTQTPSPKEDSATADGGERKGPQLVSTSSPASAATGGAPDSALTLGELTDLPEAAAMDELPPAGASDFADSQDSEPSESLSGDMLPAGPTAEEAADAARAYNATVDRLDTALRAADPGGERIPEMSFERLTQSLYTQALMLLGGAAQPGENPRVDILGARQTIDMLSVLSEKSAGNLSSDEEKLLSSALFDLRMGFLEITQALARQAAQRGGQGPGGPMGAGGPLGSGPRIVR